MKGGTEEPLPLSMAEYKSRSADVTEPDSISPLRLTSVINYNGKKTIGKTLRAK